LIGSIEKYEDLNIKSGFHHYSGIYKNGKPYFIGCNTLRNVYNGKNVWFSTHAEMSVLSKVLRQCNLQPFKDEADLSHFVIVVVRYGRDGCLKNSRPCNHCLDMMIRYRIKRIVYSTDDGIQIEKPENMEKLHVSSGWSAYINPERLNKLI